MRPRGMGWVVTAVVLLGAGVASAQEQMPPNEENEPDEQAPYGEPPPSYEPAPTEPPAASEPSPNPPVYRPPPPPRYRPPPHARRYSPYPMERAAPSPHVRVPIEVTPSAGFAMSTGVPVVGGTLMLAPSPVFGASIDVGDWFGARFEFNYMLQNTGLVLQPSGVGENQGQYDVTAHHFQIGGELDILHGGVRPFLGIILGTVWLAPHSDVPDELWFEATFEAGAKVRLTRMLGIRAQAQVTTVAMDARSQIFCSNGCYTEWYGIGTSQLALTAGPTLAF